MNWKKHFGQRASIDGDNPVTHVLTDPCAHRILVVDDERATNRSICKVLEREGYFVKSAYDGEEALQAYRSFRPNLIVLDVMMPKQNGYRVSRMLKTLLGPKAAPKIVIVTARTLDHDRDREKSTNQFSMADEVLYKPFRFEELLQKIGSLLGQRAPVGRL